MSNYVESAAELVGKTPLLKLNGYSKKAGVTEANIFGKLEYLNPAGSVKDRIALAMIKDAEDKGLLKPGATIIVVIQVLVLLQLQQLRAIEQFLHFQIQCQ